jgi:glycosyltransferase involved in cell wall biosynthesis
VRVLHAGPGGAYSDDGTMEILKKWHIPVSFCAIDEGFGVVRTKAIRSSPCDWVMVLDADERFFPVHRALTCSGESTPHSEVDSILQTYDFHDLSAMLPNWENVARLGAKLKVDAGETYDQGARLRDMLSPPWGDLDAVAVTRRHWHDFSFKKPTQNWHTDPDPQMRLVRNHESVYFDPGTRMHERLVGANKVYRCGDSGCALFFDHFHFTFKKMEVEQRSHDVAIYNAIHEGRRPPTTKEFRR